ncbi:ABC transporter ATP-binding protein [Devosia sp. ZB163]|uniref:ABC transporter ATP-binding protein n=1 Tax=Devosia sp. ZB163 TaxID=3025938 RepID=UPI0023611365|nr:ABC transporter ATP-binding protein [Devosia sp. ZB163]MDC9825149.1 ABC transporter ATP-binding protein [Devosia sp. ZB163]
MTTDLPTTAPTVLEVRSLSVEFALRGGTFTAARDVGFKLQAGRTLCLVGESGSGKSVTARAMMQLIDAPGRIARGNIMLGGAGAPVDIATLNPRGEAIRAIRGRRIGMIFQEPMSSLSPVHTIGAQIVEVLRLHLKMDAKQARARTIELLRQVEIPDPERNIDRYTFEFSGGMRQRAMIAMALACNPQVLIADEPTTALDVTTQAEVLDLISRMQRELGMAMLLITHDMGVVAEVADDVAVMYRGKIVEAGPVDEVFHNARHPYTRRLLSSVLKLERTSELKQAPAAAAAEPILSVRDLGKVYQPRKSLLSRTPKVAVKAVDGVSFDLMAGESLGIVGESGSGKTTLGRLILRIVEPTDGAVTYRPQSGAPIDVRGLDKQGLRNLHQQVRLIFQDPFASLNPRMTVRQIIADPLVVNRIASGAALEARVSELLGMVGLDPAVMERYPHAFSGGQRQRIGIARALALNPRILIADEATSALDVSIRSQMLDLLLELQQRLGLSFLFISHDIGVVRYFCDRVAVMRRGKIVEIGAAETICTAPEHPYTKALISAVPHPDPRHKRMRTRTHLDA